LLVSRALTNALCICKTPVQSKAAGSPRPCAATMSDAPHLARVEMIDAIQRQVVGMELLSSRIEATVSPPGAESVPGVGLLLNCTVSEQRVWADPASTPAQSLTDVIKISGSQADRAAQGVRVRGQASPSAGILCDRHACSPLLCSVWADVSLRQVYCIHAH
jgi:hypothetical protein